MIQMMKVSLPIFAVLMCNSQRVAAAEDPFTKGSVWQGTRVFQNDQKQEWSLKITRRQAPGFEGELTLDTPVGPKVIAVKGSAPGNGDGPMSFETQGGKPLAQKFRGRVFWGEMSLSFEGTALNGKAVSGTGKLMNEARLAAEKRNQEYKARLAGWDAEMAKLTVDELAKWVKSLPQTTAEERSKHSHCKLAYKTRLEAKWKKEIAALTNRELCDRFVSLPRGKTEEEYVKYDEYRKAYVERLIRVPDPSTAARISPEQREQWLREEAQSAAAQAREAQRIAREKQFEDIQRVQREQQRIELQRQKQ